MDSSLISESTGEENNTHQSNCPTKFRKTSSSSSNYMESLPGDLTFEILVRVPAQDIHTSARLVCRKWHNIIRTRDFKHAHFHRSPFGLLAHDQTYCTRRNKLLTFVSKADDLSIEISKFSYRSQQNLLSSCNGLVLATSDKPHYFYITNPATDRNLELAPFFSKKRSIFGCAMAYVATTTEYKVVCSFPHYDSKRQSGYVRVAILTVGVDRDWTRFVNTQHLSPQAKELLVLGRPLTTQGFVHWTGDDRYENQFHFVLNLNVETEIFSEFPVPCLRRPSHGNGKTEFIYLTMGSYLSLLVKRCEFSWDFWEMKPGTGEWTEMPSIELPEDEFVVRNSDGKKMKPVGWLRPREVLLFSHVSCYFAFNVGTGKQQEFTLDEWVNCFLVHRNTLEWINGC